MLHTQYHVAEASEFGKNRYVVSSAIPKHWWFGLVFSSVTSLVFSSVSIVSVQFWTVMESVSSSVCVFFFLFIFIPMRIFLFCILHDCCLSPHLETLARIHLGMHIQTVRQTHARVGVVTVKNML